MASNPDPLAPETVEEMVPRDRWGRPMIIPPGGGKAEPYTRCTTFVKAIDGDSSALAQWKQRLTAMGLARRPDLLLGVASAGDGSTPESKRELNKLADAAMEAAASSAAATTGTALHKFTEMHDKGEPVDLLPAQFRPDLEAYIRTTAAAGLAAAQVETFGVHDALKVAGTWDRLNVFRGRHYIGDVKTGRVDDLAIGKISMQLAIYSRCKRYDPQTGQRIEQPEVDQDRAIIIHLPAGTGTCKLYWVDIAAGWEAAEQLAARARKWQTFAKMKNLAEEIDPGQLDLNPAAVALPAPDPADAGAVALQQQRTAAAMTNGATPEAEAALMQAINSAGSLERLNGLWETSSRIWTPEHIAAATARKQALAQQAATA